MTGKLLACKLDRIFTHLNTNGIFGSRFNRFHGDLVSSSSVPGITWADVYGRIGPVASHTFPSQCSLFPKNFHGKVGSFGQSPHCQQHFGRYSPCSIFCLKHKFVRIAGGIYEKSKLLCSCTGCDNLNGGSIHRNIFPILLTQIVSTTTAT